MRCHAIMRSPRGSRRREGGVRARPEEFGWKPAAPPEKADGDIVTLVRLADRRESGFGPGLCGKGLERHGHLRSRVRGALKFNGTAVPVEQALDDREPNAEALLFKALAVELREEPDLLDLLAAHPAAAIVDRKST